jgi:FKBP-type peptidyl-prolyl cis-trans isomerase FklB
MGGFMKSTFAVMVGVLLLVSQAFGAEDTLLKNQRDKVSYTLGVYSGKNLKQQSIDIDPDIMVKGMKDSLSGAQTLLTEEEMREVMKAFQNEMAIKLTEKRMALAEKNKKEGEAFLAENKTKEGVKTLPSGVQYKIIKEGTGNHPKATDTVVVHYRGTRIDGTEFDSSYRRNKEASFKLDSVIKGWKEALLMMKEGEQWQIFIPSNLAYGEKGSGAIEPNSTLIFDTELIKIIEHTHAVTPPQTTNPGAKSSEPAAENTSNPAATSSKPAAGN